MNCEKCNSALPYGARYCNTCGEKVPDGAYDAEYKRTVWAKLDRMKDEYDSFFLKKITGSIVFKVISLIVVLGYFFFTMYGNLMGIRLKDNEAYTIQYNKQADEYYISPRQSQAQLELYVPIGTDSVVFTAFDGGKETDTKKYTTEQYRKEGYTVNEGEYDYILIDAVRKDKSADKIKIIVVNEG